MEKEKLANELLETFQGLSKIRAQKNMGNMLVGSNLILSYMAKNQGNIITPGLLSADLHISTARVATVLNLLEEKGFITRVASKKDKRKFLLEITEDGLNRSNKLKNHGIEMIVNLFEEIGESDSTEFVRISKKIYQNILRRFNEEENA